MQKALPLSVWHALGQGPRGTLHTVTAAAQSSCVISPLLFLWSVCMFAFTVCGSLLKPSGLLCNPCSKNCSLRGSQVGFSSITVQSGYVSHPTQYCVVCLWKSCIFFNRISKH